jgi:hypothetical protein
MKRILAVTLSCSFLIGCNLTGQRISKTISASFQASEVAPIDIAAAAPGDWDRFCVLTPYTNNERAEKVLGFKWDAESNTSIASNDGINVLVFIQENKVAAFAEHPRNSGDFSKMKPSCLKRQSARVVRKPDSNGWVYLVSENDA